MANVHNELNKALREIAELEARKVELPVLRPGPNSWDEIQPGDFGHLFDYRVEFHGTVTVLVPDSTAALQWCYAHLPEDAPRWGLAGYVVEPRYIDAITAGMRRDGLVSEDDYADAMNERELQFAAHQAQEDES